jgi:hypothetical protein
MLGRSAELVAYGWKQPSDSLPADFCIWVGRPPDVNEFGTCASALSGTTGAIAIDMQIQAIAPKAARATTIGGRIAPEVAAVRLYFRRRNGAKRHRVDALVAQVNGDLQRRLKQPNPFGFFYVQVRGLVPFKSFKAQALDPSGNVIGTAGRQALFPW